MTLNLFVYENSRGYTYSEEANSFVRCWKALSKDLINKAWNLDAKLGHDFVISDGSPNISSDDKDNEDKCLTSLMMTFFLLRKTREMKKKEILLHQENLTNKNAFF